jgi:hypothetical protein
MVHVYLPTRARSYAIERARNKYYHVNVTPPKHEVILRNVKERADVEPLYSSIERLIDERMIATNANKCVLQKGLIWSRGAEAGAERVETGQKKTRTRTHQPHVTRAEQQALQDMKRSLSSGEEPSKVQNNTKYAVARQHSHSKQAYDANRPLQHDIARKGASAISTLDATRSCYHPIAGRL